VTDAQQETTAQKTAQTLSPADLGIFLRQNTTKIFRLACRALLGITAMQPQLFLRPVNASQDFIAHPVHCSLPSSAKLARCALLVLLRLETASWAHTSLSLLSRAA